LLAISFYDQRQKFHAYPEIMGLPLIHAGYVITTQNKKTIVVSSKYVYTYGGYTRFMVVDNTGTHYAVENSIWFWRWNAIEDWERIQIGSPIRIHYYGWRIAPFGVFPNIVRTSNSSELRPYIQQPNQIPIDTSPYAQILSMYL